MQFTCRGWFRLTGFLSLCFAQWLALRAVELDTLMHASLHATLAINAVGFYILGRSR